MNPNENTADDQILKLIGQKDENYRQNENSLEGTKIWYAQFREIRDLARVEIRRVLLEAGIREGDFRFPIVNNGQGDISLLAKDASKVAGIISENTLLVAEKGLTPFEVDVFLPKSTETT